MGYAFSKDALLAAFAMMGFPGNDLRADGIGLGLLSHSNLASTNPCKAWRLASKRELKRNTKQNSPIIILDSVCRLISFSVLDLMLNQNFYDRSRR